MAPTRTIKNKHSSKSSSSSSSNPKRSSKDGIKKPSSSHKPKAKIPSKEQKGKPNFGQDKKKKSRVYTEKELGIPELNMITPVGVTKPKGKKKGKIFVDDKESMSTILSLILAEKEGQIESKLLKARQMEEIREARKAEADKKEQDRKAKLDETKELMRKKRKKTTGSNNNKKDDEEEDKIVKDAVVAGTKAGKKTAKGNKKKSVSFAE
ncbi:60S ribosomal subunit assembly protein LOC1 [Triangularia verruculosa]|uniref:60S ribosomal subunit assembly protein LOC1 n=1 Tax=Triangularia verruculosa TaxID=2587418 RepID=A0AAN6XMW2_9PEZI|nr:60S ribosomal subunit assembly protein LOC1 [Triangularia verruculosa]